MGLRAPESKNGDHFFTRTPPQNGGLGICFMCSPRKDSLEDIFQDYAPCSLFRYSAIWTFKHRTSLRLNMGTYPSIYSRPSTWASGKLGTLLPRIAAFPLWSRMPSLPQRWGARSPIFGHLKMGTFGISKCLKMGLRAPELKNGDHIYKSNISI